MYDSEVIDKKWVPPGLSIEILRYVIVSNLQNKNFIFCQNPQE